MDNAYSLNRSLIKCLRACCIEAVEPFITEALLQGVNDVSPQATTLMLSCISIYRQYLVGRVCYNVLHEAGEKLLTLLNSDEGERLYEIDFLIKTNKMYLNWTRYEKDVSFTFLLYIIYSITNENPVHAFGVLPETYIDEKSKRKLLIDKLLNDVMLYPDCSSQVFDACQV